MIHGCHSFSVLSSAAISFSPSAASPSTISSSSATGTLAWWIPNHLIADRLFMATSPTNLASALFDHWWLPLDCESHGQISSRISTYHDSFVILLLLCYVEDKRRQGIQCKYLTSDSGVRIVVQSHEELTHFVLFIHNHNFTRHSTRTSSACAHRNFHKIVQLIP